MPNEITGTKIYTILVEYNSRTGLPTGRVKPNVPSDPDYVPPVYDPVNCAPTSLLGSFSNGFSNGFDIENT